MVRTAFPGSLLVLEGSTDSKFWLPRIQKNECHIVLAGAKNTVTNAVTRAAKLSGIIGVVDDDYDSLCGVATSPHLVRTVSRDLESMLLASPALDRVIQEICDDEKVRAFELAERLSVREALVARSLLFGKLRWLNRLESWNFAFDDLSPFRFGNKDDWTINHSAVLEVVAGAVGLPPADLENALKRLTVADPYRVLHGRDALAVLALGLKVLGSRREYSIDSLFQFLRLAYDDATANASALFIDVRRWESANPPFVVLRVW